jgi:molybdopterin/thiamine biosynthesis adenylyltransferase
MKRARSCPPPLCEPVAVRRRTASPPVATADRASLERFQRELIEAGFKAIDPPERRIWQGPIAPTLTALTEAKTMRLQFIDGWPYRQPRLLVDGISGDHTNIAGEVCLWPTGARSRGWLTLQGLYDRIDDWAEAAQAGFPDDTVLDAHLYFDLRRPGIATIDLHTVGPCRRGEMGRIHGRWLEDRLVLELSTKRREEFPLEGRWYHIDHVSSTPRNIGEVRTLLTKPQADSLDAGLSAVADGKGERLVLLVWETAEGANTLTLTQGLIGEMVVVEAVETAPTDHRYLAMRAGPDFETLQSKRVVQFGAGAVGSHLAVRLAECGVGKIAVCDGDLLRPGNVVRHIGRRSQIGLRKTEVVRRAILERVQWTRVGGDLATWNSDTIAERVGDADLVIDATGNGGFTDLLSAVCQLNKKPLVAAALYRRGSVARVERQANASDTPIVERDGATDPRYPLIPPGSEPAPLEPGCTAPVNNAPPSAVAALAAQAAEVAIDALTGRFQYGDDLIEVYRPLDVAPFDRAGTIRVEP